MVRILITGVGGPTPRSFAISLKEYGQRDDYFLVATDVNRFSVGLYNSALFDKSYVVPHSTQKELYWKEIERIIQVEKIDYAVILPELEVIEWSKRQANGTLPCKVLLPDISLAEILVHKSKMTEILGETGMVPESVSFLRTDTNYLDLVKPLGYPFWVRSASGTSGLGSLLVEDSDALKNWIQINGHVTEFLASSYLPGRNLACKLLYYNGKLVRTACAERVSYIMSKVSPSGITGNTSFGRLINNPDLVDRSIKAMNILFDYSKSKKHGFFTVDFKEDSFGIPFITEINVRHVAFTQCFAACGANFAEDTLDLLSDSESFDNNLIQYQFEKGTIFLRDVDALPIIMNERELL
ncbi:hypothetical protein GCM10027036_38710 [Flavihumibacter cheonanensis]|uniref:hypothetical protein n=1 Tax=Flavihumibacter cheonanensis TaxID=1442385 RepID=UPI001EF928F5|nr:hypothetical protein [Flavihumibacter cheonanensis]MCG7753874.1 hypothetical protein [Flavihumibacter cheonanensis]